MKKKYRFVKFNDEKVFHHVFVRVQKIFQWKKHYQHRSIVHKKKVYHRIERLKLHVFNRQIQSNRKWHHRKHQIQENFVLIVLSQKIVFVLRHYLSILRLSNRYLHLPFIHIFHHMQHIHQVQ